MSFDTAAGKSAPAPLALQFINIEIAPLMSGRLSVAIQATLLDESELEFIGEKLVQTSTDNLDGAIAIIRESTGILNRRMNS
jgi:hypothetical protein